MSIFKLVIVSILKPVYYLVLLIIGVVAGIIFLVTHLTNEYIIECKFLEEINLFLALTLIMILCEFNFQKETEGDDSSSDEEYPEQVLDLGEKHHFPSKKEIVG